MTDGSGRWSSSPPGGARPGHTGALYDPRAQAAGYPPGAPHYVAPSTGAPAPGGPGSAPIAPVSSGGPSATSAWWSDARGDPWRDPFAPSAVVITPPAPPAVEPPDLDRPERRVTFRQVLLISVLSALLAGGLGGALGYLAAVRGGVAGTGSVIGAGTGGGVSALTNRAPTSLAAVVKTVLPSVVTVRVDGQFSSSIGTGFIVSTDGYMITNDHVIDGLDGGTATITFSDSTTSTATLVGADVESDIAVLKINRTGLSPVTFGDSDSVQVGDPVLAIGSPLDLPNTVTYGIVSALQRPLEVDDGSGTTRYYAAIQTDAAVNHGNSGGPLVDSGGRVIGVNAVIESGSANNDPQAGNIGLAFAIPINQVERVANALISSGKVPHSIIGATTGQADPDGGVEIASVVGGGPADQAGLRAGDVVLEVGTAPIMEAGDLTALIRAYAPGTLVTIVYSRDGARHSVQVKLIAATG